MKQIGFIGVFALVAVVGCGGKDKNPAVPKVPKAAVERIESAMNEARMDVFAKQFRTVGEVMVQDQTLHLQNLAKGTPLETEANELHEMALKFGKFCMNPKTPQKKLQEIFNELEAKVQIIKSKV